MNELGADAGDEFLEAPSTRPIGQVYAAGRYTDKVVLTISIQKLDNGYVLGLEEPAKFPPPPPPEEIEEIRRKQLKENQGKIDAMIDGIIAFQKYVMDKSTGEDWKGEDAKDKIREGFKALFPSYASNPIGRPALCTPPRVERMVFGKVEELVEYLKKNL